MQLPVDVGFSLTSFFYHFSHYYWYVRIHHSGHYISTPVWKYREDEIERIGFPFLMSYSLSTVRRWRNLSQLPDRKFTYKHENDDIQSKIIRSVQPWWFHCHSYTDSCLSDGLLCNVYTSLMCTYMLSLFITILQVSMYIIQNWHMIDHSSQGMLYQLVSCLPLSFSKWLHALCGCRPSLTIIEEKHSSKLFSWSKLLELLLLPTCTLTRRLTPRSLFSSVRAYNNFAIMQSIKNVRGNLILISLVLYTSKGWYHTQLTTRQNVDVENLFVS